MGKPYIRKKGNKFVIEFKDKNNKTIYLKQLPPAVKLLEILKEAERRKDD